MKTLLKKKDLNVLIVEDDLVDYTSVERALAKSGEASYTLAWAETLERGKRMLETRDFDAIILDLGLPDSDGLDSVIDFNASSPATPIVVLTGQQTPNLAFKSLSLGAADFLEKRLLSCSNLEEKIRSAQQQYQIRLQEMDEALKMHVSRIGPTTYPSNPVERQEYRNALKAGLLGIQAFPVIKFKDETAFAYRLRFSLYPGQGVINERTLYLAREDGSLLELTLNCIKRAFRFSRDFSVNELHLDFETELAYPDFIREILDLLSSKERAQLSLFFPAQFNEADQDRVIQAASLLAQSGIKIGIRDFGAGGTAIDNISRLNPSWIRFSPLLYLGLADFKIKRDYLKHWISTHDTLKIPLLADDANRDDFPILEKIGLSGAVLG